MQPIALLFTET